jgi:methionyl-tRNA formyltransferase
VAAVNIHPSLLPEYRGVDPVFYARLRGATKLGVTVHHLSEFLDAGNVLAQTEVSADSTMSILRATAMFYCQGADMLIGSLPRIASGDPGVPQEGQGCYDSWPTPVCVRRLRTKGTALVRASDLLGMAMTRGSTHP